MEKKDFKSKGKGKAPVNSDVVNAPLNQAAVVAATEEVVEHVKKRERRPRGFLDGRVTAREREIFQLSDALVAAIIRDENLAAPDRAIVTVARPIEREADDGTRPVQSVLGHAGRDVSVVVLNVEGWKVGMLGAF